MRRIVLVLTVAAIAALVVSVLTPPVRLVAGRDEFPDKTRAWIVVSQDDQQMLIYEGNRVVRQLPVSTGWPGVRKSITPVFGGVIGPYWGTFESFGTLQDHGYYLFTDYLPAAADYRAWNRPGNGAWNGDVLVHGAPYRHGPNGEKEYILDGIGTVPTSNGCIRMQPEDAEWFAAWDPVGVSITIKWFSNGTLDYPKLGVGAQLAGLTQDPAARVEGARPGP